MESTHESIGAPAPQIAPIPPKAAGSACNFDEFVGRTYDRVFAFILRRVGKKDEATAQDLTQETFAKAYRAWGTFDQSRSEIAWVITVAKNLAGDYFESLAREKRYLPKQPADDIPGRNPNSLLDQFAEAEEEADRREQLHFAIEQLAEADKELINLYLAGLSYPEIGANLDLSATAVGARLTRLREKLTSFVSVRARD